MTFTQIQARVQQIVQDTSGTNLLNIQNWINDGQQDFASRCQFWPWLLSSSTFPTVSNSNTYSLSSDVHSIINLRDETNNAFIAETDRKVFELAFPYVNQSTDVNAPTQWFRFGVGSSGCIQIKLHPVPAGVYTIRYDYYKEITDMSGSTDVSVIPSRYHKALISYAVTKYFEMKQDPMADYHSTQYENEVYKAISDTSESDNQAMMIPGKRIGHAAKSVADEYFLRL